MRHFLVIVRAGDASLHNRWFDAQRSRTWDVMINYYCEPPKNEEPGVEYVVTGGVSKYSALKTIFSNNQSLLDSYEGFFFLDDDIDVKFDDIDRLFHVFARYDFLLAQPALTHDSFWTWDITLRCPVFEVRFTNFVEIMAPMMARQALLSLLDTFDQSVSGWGLDLVWPKILGYPVGRIGIIDAVGVRHSRRIDIRAGPFYRYLRSIGIDPSAEAGSLIQRYGINDVHPTVCGAVVIPARPPAARDPLVP